MQGLLASSRYEVSLSRHVKLSSDIALLSKYFFSPLMQPWWSTAVDPSSSVLWCCLIWLLTQPYEPAFSGDFWSAWHLEWGFDLFWCKLCHCSKLETLYDDLKLRKLSSLWNLCKTFAEPQYLQLKLVCSTPSVLCCSQWSQRVVVEMGASVLQNNSGYFYF